MDGVRTEEIEALVERVRSGKARDLTYDELILLAETANLYLITRQETLRKNKLGGGKADPRRKDPT